MTTEPHYQHDCERCVFLGDYESDGQIFDLYFCPYFPTVVARRSSEPGDYMSGLAVASLVLPLPLLEAQERSQSRGLIGVL